MLKPFGLKGAERVCTYPKDAAQPDHKKMKKNRCLLARVKAKIGANYSCSKVNLKAGLKKMFNYFSDIWTDLVEDGVEAWSEDMTRAIMLMCRHAQQSVLKCKGKPPPDWLQEVLFIPPKAIGLKREAASNTWRLTLD